MNLLDAEFHISIPVRSNSTKIQYVAKASPEDILIRITVANRGSEPAELHVFPTLWSGPPGHCHAFPMTRLL